MSNNFRQFTRRIPIKAPAKAIYDAWTTQQGLESWFLRLAAFTDAAGAARGRTSRIASGDHYKWLWHGYDDSATQEREIMEVKGWDKLQFSFSGGCIVTVTVKQESGETICELVQDMPMEDSQKRQAYYIDCGNGWGFYLVNLKSILEGGSDLRNRNVNLHGVINS
jgi:uncharacterized protein YndB with AHSA1/START domain